MFEDNFEQLVVERPSVIRDRVDQADELTSISTTLTCTNLLSSIIGSKIIVNQTQQNVEEYIVALAEAQGNLKVYEQNLTSFIDLYQQNVFYYQSKSDELYS